MQLGSLFEWRLFLRQCDHQLIRAQILAESFSGCFIADNFVR